MDEIDGGEEKEKEESFELMQDDSIRQIDFNSILFRQMDRIARWATEGNLPNFGNGVSLLDAYLINFQDDKFFKDELKKIEDKYRQIFIELEEHSKNDNIKAEETQSLFAHYESEKILERLKLLMKILGRNKRV